jgi:hypothetical protein
VLELAGGEVELTAEAVSLGIPRIAASIGRKLDERCARRRRATGNIMSLFRSSVWLCGQGRVEPPTYRFSGQPRRALCRPKKTDVTHERKRARRKVQDLR